MSFISWVKNMFSKFIKAFKGLIKGAFPLARQIIIGQLIDFAMQIVDELGDEDYSGEQKRQEAFGKIKEFAKINAIEAKDSLINALIEICVLKFKKEF